MYADEAGSRDQLVAVSDKIGVLAVAVGLDRAGMILGNALGVFVVDVDDTGFAAPEEQGFTGEVLRHVLVLAVADMIAGEVGEDTVIKEDAVGAVPFQSEGGRFDDHRLAAFIDHTAHRLLNLIAFGGGIVGLVDPVVDEDAQRSDGTGLDAGVLQDGADHGDRGGLALGAGDRDGGQLLGGSAEEFDAHQRQHRSRVFNADDRHAVVCDTLVLNDQRLSAAFYSVGDEFVAVNVVALQGDERTALDDLAAVVDNVLDLDVE